MKQVIMNSNKNFLELQLRLYYSDEEFAKVKQKDSKGPDWAFLFCFGYSIKEEKQEPNDLLHGDMEIVCTVTTEHKFADRKLFLWITDRRPLSLGSSLLLLLTFVR